MQRQLCLCPPIFGLESPFYAVVKDAAKMVGVNISTHVLPPPVLLTETKRNKVRETLGRLGVLA